MGSEVQATKSRRDRPTGVFNIVTWLILSSIVTLLFIGIPLIARFSTGGSFSLGVVSDIIAILLSVIALVLARGLWMLKLWAVPGTIGLLTVSILSKVVWAILVHTVSGIVIQALAIALDVWIILYLATNQKVREAFGRA